MQKRAMVAAGLTLLGTGLALAQNRPTREEKVRGDKARVEAQGFWIYNDLARGVDEAKKTGKPLLVVLRCIPCEECVKLDDDLIDQDPRLQPLLKRFVPVRIVSTNGLDLSLFQFDTDQSFAVFLLNADGTIYGRFGTRSHRTNWLGDVSVEGMAKALEGALALHKAYPTNRAALAKKRGPAPDFPVPEKFPSLSGRFGPKLDYSGNVVRSCIHCHQIGDARNAWLTEKGPLPEKFLFPYPHPKAIGLILDPQEKASVRSVTPDSPAAAAGFQPGDALVSLDGQPLLSFADIQWVLHHASPDGATIPVTIRRASATHTLSLRLPPGWRRRDDISWRVSSWEWRRKVLGGLYLVPLPDGERLETGLPADAMALKVEHVGQYPPHDEAKKAGVVAGDILIGYDGKTDLTRETDVIAHGLTQRKAGDTVTLSLLHDGQKVERKIPITR